VRPRPGTSKPELSVHALESDREVTVAGTSVLPLALPHGDVMVFGYRVGRIAYLTDAKSIPEPVRVRLRGLDVLVLNALLPGPHPLHLSIPEAVAAAQQIGARRTLLTHLTHETRHADLAAQLPAGIAPAYDGLVIDVDEA
jgi:phosphoribosyl 1,2-cyclic phosphate phosphodiesterase